MDIVTQNIKKIITEKAAFLGFEKIGFARYEVLEKEGTLLQKWIDLGYDADMSWIKKGLDKRRDIKNIMPDAKSIISLAYNYYTPYKHDESKPKISRYALGKDYHEVLKKKLKELIKYCIENLEVNETVSTGNEINMSFKSRLAMKFYVDDGPVMDKAWTIRSGIGWQGKHTNVINPEFGSWFFISNIITNIEFESYDTAIEDQCGSCTLCISACPTGAIVDEYVVDSNKCISYHTIENRGEIPSEINLRGWIFGCDICQDVCPFNSPKHNRITNDSSFYPLPELNSLENLDSITEEEFNQFFSESPIKRTKYKGLKRNLRKI